MSQLLLLPDAAPELRRETLPLDAIDGFAEAKPSAKLRELIRDLGLLQPIVVAATRSGRHELVEGRRRCKAIAQLTVEGQWPAPPRVEALILDGAKPVGREVRGGLALALHATRSASPPPSELRAIEAILKTGGTDGEATTVKEIAAQTGMSVQTVRRRLRLRSLTPALRDVFDDGKITASIAEAAARLPEREQQMLATQLAERGRLTLPKVRDVARERTAETHAELPGELFSDRAVPWQAIVRGHIVAALEATPADQRDGPLSQLLERVVTEVERA